MKKERILVVEDEAVIALDLENRLENLGYKVAGRAFSGQKAIEMTDKLRPDLVLMDIVLKGTEDGILAAEEIRIRFNIPVIYLTAHSSESMIQRAMIAEPFGYILKPIEDRELYSAIELAIYKHQIERRLKDNEQWLATTLKSIGDAVVVTDSQGMIRFMNPVAEAIAGCSQNYALGHCLSDLFSIVSGECNIEENPVSQALSEGTIITISDCILASAKDGRKTPIDCTAAPTRDRNGLILGVVLILRDITERKRKDEEILRSKEELERRVVERTSELTKANRDLQEEIKVRIKAEEDLRSQRLRFETLTENAPFGMALIAGGCSFKYINPKFRDLFGYDQEEIQTENCWFNSAFPDPAYREKAVPAWLGIIDGLCEGEKGFKDFIITCKDGSQRAISFGYVNLGNDECLITCDDITKRKQAQEALRKAKESAEEAAQAKSEFLARMSHEIRTPLNAIIGMTDLLSDTELSGEEKDGLDTIRCSSDALLEIINELLDFSKIESGKAEVVRESFDLIKCIEASMDLVSGKASEKGLGLGLVIDPSVPTRIMGDTTRLRQVLVNLLSNAIKFSDAGKIDASVDASNDEGLYEIRFSVKDTGIGIPRDELGKLFMPFSQVDASISRLYGGAGLGLAISKSLVELMGGRIWAESEPGLGSTFHFTIRAEACQDIQRSEGDIQTAIGPRVMNGSNLSILLAEDNLVNQKVALRMLRRLGYEADAVTNGAEALRALESRHYDVVLMDVQMPEMNGLEATRKIRSRWLASEQPYIIALTAYAMKEDRDKCIESGMEDYIAKPMKIKELKEALERIGRQPA